MTLPLGQSAAVAPLPHDHLSPSIQRTPLEKSQAYEYKFLIAADLAVRVEQWAQRGLQLDSHINPALGSYQITTLYLDTPAFDVFYRSRGFRSSKYRLRRYASDARVFLERKTRRGDRVEKRRTDVPLGEVSQLAAHLAIETWPGPWFGHKAAQLRLGPICRITYERAAYVGLDDSVPFRLTLDRNIRGERAGGWDLLPIADSVPTVLAEQVVCEFKFRGRLPRIIRDFITDLNLTPAGVSKYRRVMAATTPEGFAHA